MGEQQTMFQAEKPKQPPNFDEVAARRKLGDLPESWRVFRWEVLDSAGTTLIEGSETTVYQRGPRKGRTKWTMQTRRVICVTPAEVDAEQQAWERETGDCGNCGGSGQRWIGWNHKTGDRFGPCRRCSESGRAPGTAVTWRSDNVARGIYKDVGADREGSE